MKAFKITAVIVLAGVLFLTNPALAAPQAKTYQVTGEVLELTDTTIIVQKGEDRWQVARDKYEGHWGSQGRSEGNDPVSLRRHRG